LGRHSYKGGDIMKLVIKDEYFMLIKRGMKREDYRDAHITFINEKTGETMVKRVIAAHVMNRPKSLYPDVLKDDLCINFYLEDPADEYERKNKKNSMS
jgi:hypothetical protein